MSSKPLLEWPGRLSGSLNATLLPLHRIQEVLQNTSRGNTGQVFGALVGHVEQPEGAFEALSVLLAGPQALSMLSGGAAPQTARRSSLCLFQAVGTAQENRQGCSFVKVKPWVFSSALFLPSGAHQPLLACPGVRYIPRRDLLSPLHSSEPGQRPF